MIIAVDFDDTIVSQAGRSYDDVTTPLQFMPGAREALTSLKRAGHVLLLYSGRSNRSGRIDPDLDPMVRAGLRRVDRGHWEENRKINEARYQQMVRFAYDELPGIFDVIDDGQQGKPYADLFIDDRALSFGRGPLSMRWDTIARVHGEPVYASGETA